MEFLLALVSGTLYASGIYLMLKRRLAQIIVGLSMMANGSNLLIFTAAGLTRGRAPILDEGATGAEIYAEPVPQSLVLTAIVIGFATTALFLVVLLTSRGLTGNDHVDGKDGTP